jgi:hypothetical protein
MSRYKHILLLRFMPWRKYTLKRWIYMRNITQLYFSEFVLHWRGWKCDRRMWPAAVMLWFCVPFYFELKVLCSNVNLDRHFFPPKAHILQTLVFLKLSHLRKVWIGTCHSLNSLLSKPAVIKICPQSQGFNHGSHSSRLVKESNVTLLRRSKIIPSDWHGAREHHCRKYCVVSFGRLHMSS